MSKTPKPKPEPDDGPTFLDRAGDIWHGMEGWMQGVILLGLCVGTLYGFLKWLQPFKHFAEFRSDARSIRDTLVGRPAMRDSITGRPIPGTQRPGIGERMDDMAESVKTLVQNNQRLEDHEKRLTRLEDVLQIDRRLDKIESVQLLRTIETVAQAEGNGGPTIGGDERPGDEEQQP